MAWLGRTVTGPILIDANAKVPRRRHASRSLGANIRDAVTGAAALIAVFGFSGYHLGIPQLIEYVLVPAEARRNMQIWREQQANKPALEAEEAGRAASKAHDYQAAIRHYSRAIELYGPDSVAAAWSYHMRAFALQGLGRREDALPDHSKALALNPYFPGGYRWRGTLLMELDRNDEALKDLDTALSQLPNSPSTIIAHGEVLEKLGRREESLLDYAKAVPAANDFYGKAGTLSPSLIPKELKEKFEEQDKQLLAYRDDLIALGYLRHGNLLRNLNHTDEALSDYAAALAVRPDDGLIFANRGWLYEKQGRLDLARADYAKAATLMSGYEWLDQALARTR